MVYQGNRITVTMLEDGIANMQYNAENESVNKFDAETNKQFGEVVSALEKANDVKGLIVTSSKGVFIAGADITEFVASLESLRARLENGASKSTTPLTALKICHSRKWPLLMVQHSAVVVR